MAVAAKRQHGVVARRQLREWGMASDAIDRRLLAGRLHRIHAGVYAVGHEVLSREGHWMAAVLAAGPGAVLSHSAAAALWRIRNPSSGAIHVTTPRKCRSTQTIRRHRSRIPADEVTVVEGIPVTTVPRTLFDLAAVSSVENVEFALREAEYRRLHDPLSLPDLLARYPGRRGSRAIRACLARRAEHGGRTRSPLEEVFVPFLRRHRLPLPRLNAWIELAGSWKQVDCLWDAQRVVAELDGYAGHGTRTAFREDRARDRRLRVAGYDVVRIAWTQLEDEPESIAADLRALLAASELAYKRL
jgi:predicted transcriptional regulator of viral defense system